MVNKCCNYVYDLFLFQISVSGSCALLFCFSFVQVNTISLRRHVVVVIVVVDKYKQQCSRQKHLLLIVFEKVFKSNRSYFHPRNSHCYCICTILHFVVLVFLYNLKK